MFTPGNTPPQQVWAQVDPEGVGPGSVVYLKSGSPALTVTGVNGEGVVSVAWFNQSTEECRKESFPAASLIHAPET